MVIDTAIHSDLPIPPGEYLEEVLDDLGMSKDNGKHGDTILFMNS